MSPRLDKGGPSGGETVVIFRLGSLGDTVNSLPCFHQIARAFPKARRILLTNFPISSVAAPAAAILRDGGFVQGAVNYSIGQRDPSKLMALGRELRALNSATLIYVTERRSLITTWRDLVFFRLCGFTRVIGAPLRPDLLRGRRSPKTGEVEREVERIARCLSALGPIDLNDRANWSLNLTDQEQATAAAFLKPMGGRKLVAINTGGKVKENDWGESNWEAFLMHLAAVQPEFGLLIVGAKEDEARALHLSSFWRGPVLIGCGKFTPRESAAILQRARLFVGHDSGPLHLSAAMGVPCVSMFGDNNPPKKWHPVGDQHRIIHNMSGVMAITPDQVFEAVQDVLSRDEDAQPAPNPPPTPPPAAP